MANDKPLSDSENISLYSYDENVNHFQNNFIKKCQKYMNNGNNPDDTTDNSHSVKEIGLDLVSNVPEMCKRKSLIMQPLDHSPKKTLKSVCKPSSISSSEMFYEPPGNARTFSIDREHKMQTDELTVLKPNNVSEEPVSSIKGNCKQGTSYCTSEQNHSEAGPDIAQYLQGEFSSLNTIPSVISKGSCTSYTADKLKYCGTSFGNADWSFAYKDNLKMASDVASDVPASNVLINYSPKKIDHKVFSEEEYSRAAKMQELHYHEKQLKRDKERNEQAKNLEREKQLLKRELVMLQKSTRASMSILEEMLKATSLWMAMKEREQVEMTCENQKLMNERDQVLEDMKCVESAFADLHRRYENCKSVLEGYKQNEDRLKKQSSEMQSKLNQQEQMYEMLRARIQDKLDSANTEIEGVKKSGDAELAVLRVQMKKAEMKISGLEKDIEQKTKENIELSSICDDLLAKVGKS